MASSQNNKNIVIAAAAIIVILGGFFFFSRKDSSGGPSGPSQANLAGPQTVNGGNLIFQSAIGQQAPDFSLKDISGNTVNLKDLRGKNVVLFFNEGLMCYPACLNQVSELSKDSRLNNDKTVAFSVVVDDPSSWVQAQAKLPYLSGAKVLFDNGGETSTAYDVLRVPSSMHPGRYPGHTYFVIDKTGIVRFTLDDPYMAIRNNEVALALQKLQ